MLSPRELRVGLSKERPGWGALRWGKRHDVTDALIAQHASAAAQGVRNLVVSEENLSDYMVVMLRSGRIYGNIYRRMVRLRPLAEGNNLTVIFAIRRYDSFLSSLYALRTIREPLPPFEHFKPRLAALRVRWPEVVAEIARALPSAKIEVVTFETAHDHATAFMRTVLGLQNIAEVRDSGHRVLPSPSAQAVARLNEMKSVDDMSIERRQAVVHAFPRSAYGAFAPWDAGEAEMLVQAYEEDLDLLRSTPPPNARLLDLSRADVRSSG